MGICRSISAVNSHDGHTTAIAVPCKRWDCPQCGPKKRKVLIARAIGGQPNTFVTLTVSKSEFPDPELAAVALVEAWRIVRKRAMREAGRNVHKRRRPTGAAIPGGWTLNNRGYVQRQVITGGRRLPFIAVMEKTKAGWPHLHILLRSRWISHKWLSAQMQDTLKSPVISIERLLSNRKTAVYAAKYVGKAGEKFMFCRRYYSSQDYELREEYTLKYRKEHKLKWDVFRVPLHSLLWYMETQGHLVRMTGPFSADVVLVDTS